MEAHLYLKAETGMVGAATDFTHTWCVNMGLEPDDAARMALAVDEILTDVILYAYEAQGGYVEIWFQYSLSEIEIIIQDTGKPFDPEKHIYSPEKAIKNSKFEGAGLEIVKSITDHFLFLNRGKDGKEFRLVKNFSGSDIRTVLKGKTETDEVENSLSKESDYVLESVTSEDAEAIATLIYRSYDYSYSKEDLYFPRRIELAIRHDYKFGTIAKTLKEEPVGYFAVLMNTDSLVGEIGEAVVSPHHRKRGLMKRMLKNLVEISKERGLFGLYGMALTVHTISQKVNEKFGFKSTALLLAKTSAATYKGLREKYPQPVSMIMDFLPLTKRWNQRVYLPTDYARILQKVYGQFTDQPDIMNLPESIPREKAATDLNLKIYYESNSALIAAHVLGNSFERSSQRMIKSLDELNLTSIFIDLPLYHPWIDHAVEWLRENGFILAGLMPLFHNERDYLRMQKINTEIDFNLIETHSEIASELKSWIAGEYHAIQKRQT